MSNFLVIFSKLYRSNSQTVFRELVVFLEITTYLRRKSRNQSQIYSEDLFAARGL